MSGRGCWRGVGRRRWRDMVLSWGMIFRGILRAWGLRWPLFWRGCCVLRRLGWRRGCGGGGVVMEWFVFLSSEVEDLGWLLTSVKDHHIIPPSRSVYALSYTAASAAFMACISAFVTAIYTWLHQPAVQSTCHWEIVEQVDAHFKCTPELAVCDISPYLLKPDVSEHARASRQAACGHLVSVFSSPISAHYINIADDSYSNSLVRCCFRYCSCRSS
jgi:hypothetical protein